MLEYNIGFGNLISEEELDSDPNQFFLALGEHNDQLYAFVKIKDDALVYRDRNILRLDLSDHLRLTFTGQDKLVKNIVLTSIEPVSYTHLTLPTKA